MKHRKSWNGASKRALIFAAVVGALIASTLTAGYVGVRVERAAATQAVETSVAHARAAEQDALTAESEAEAMEAQLTHTKRKLATLERKLKDVTGDLKAEQARVLNLVSENESLKALNGPGAYPEVSEPGYASGGEDPGSPSFRYDSDPSSEYPSYDGYDLNCEDVTGPVVVPFDDPHGLDGDDDGIGCE